jgi:hypothetical protein
MRITLTGVYAHVKEPTLLTLDIQSPVIVRSFVLWHFTIGQNSSHLETFSLCYQRKELPKLPSYWFLFTNPQLSLSHMSGLPSCSNAGSDVVYFYWLRNKNTLLTFRLFLRA